MTPATPPERSARAFPAKSAMRGGTSQLREHLLALIRPVVTKAGFDLEDVSVSTVGRRKLVRLIVDRDGGVDLDGVAEVSRAVSDVLDRDVSGGAREFADPYVLEVSSPGVDRPLTEPHHWRRAAGRMVRFTADGEPMVARVLTADDLAVTVDVDGEKRELAFARLGAGKVQVEFGHHEPDAHQQRDREREPRPSAGRGGEG